MKAFLLLFLIVVADVHRVHGITREFSHHTKRGQRHSLLHSTERLHSRHQPGHHREVLDLERESAANAVELQRIQREFEENPFGLDDAAIALALASLVMNIGRTIKGVVDRYRLMNLLQSENLKLEQIVEAQVVLLEPVHRILNSIRSNIFTETSINEIEAFVRGNRKFFEWLKTQDDTSSVQAAQLAKALDNGESVFVGDEDSYVGATNNLLKIGMLGLQYMAAEDNFCVVDNLLASLKPTHVADETCATRTVRAGLPVDIRIFDNNMFKVETKEYVMMGMQFLLTGLMKIKLPEMLDTARKSIKLAKTLLSFRSRDFLKLPFIVYASIELTVRALPSSSSAIGVLKSVNHWLGYGLAVISFATEVTQLVNQFAEYARKELFIQASAYESAHDMRYAVCNVFLHVAHGITLELDSETNGDTARDVLASFKDACAPYYTTEVVNSDVVSSVSYDFIPCSPDTLPDLLESAGLTTDVSPQRRGFGRAIEAMLARDTPPTPEFLSYRKCTEPTRLEGRVLNVEHGSREDSRVVSIRVVTYTSGSRLGTWGPLSMSSPTGRVELEAFSEKGYNFIRLNPIVLKPTESALVGIKKKTYETAANVLLGADLPYEKIMFVLQLTHKGTESLLPPLTGLKVAELNPPSWYAFFLEGDKNPAMIRGDKCRKELGERITKVRAWEKESSKSSPDLSVVNPDNLFGPVNCFCHANEEMDITPQQDPKHFLLYRKDYNIHVPQELQEYLVSRTPQDLAEAQASQALDDEFWGF